MDCILASMRISIYLSVKQLPEDEKQTLRDLRKETARRFNEGFLSQDNAGKSIDQVFSEYQERQKMQAVENWLKWAFKPISNMLKFLIFATVIKHFC
jgi:hypothetical protein